MGRECHGGRHVSRERAPGEKGKFDLVSAGFLAHMMEKNLTCFKGLDGGLFCRYIFRENTGYLQKEIKQAVGVGCIYRGSAAGVWTGCGARVEPHSFVLVFPVSAHFPHVTRA